MFINCVWWAVANELQPMEASATAALVCDEETLKQRKYVYDANWETNGAHLSSLDDN
jgi:hypothetical protein